MTSMALLQDQNPDLISSLAQVDHTHQFIREVEMQNSQGQFDHGIMTFDFLKTNEAKIKSFFGSCRKLKNKDHIFCNFES